MRNEKEYISSVDMLNRLRNFNPVSLNESEDNNNTEKKENDGSVPYTQQDDILGTSLQTCRQQFGANFSDNKTPMLYYPKKKGVEDSIEDVVLNGRISSLGGAKFQFRLNDSSGYGCFVWVNPLHLDEKTLKTLSVIYGVYDNWKKDLQKSEDNRPLSIRNKPDRMPEDGDDAEL